ncbi:MAG: hypothetical protein WKG01_41450, partial [Kofleriaceae bacterium]
MTVSTSVAGVIERLNLPPTASAITWVWRRIRRLSLDTSHFRRARDRTRSWTDDQLRTAVNTCTTYAAVIRALGLVPAGGNYHQVQDRVATLGLDVSHFTLAGSRRAGPPVPLAEALV